MYGYYKCVATNKLGTAEHRVVLREAKKPGPILEAIIHEKTATSITYKIVGPTLDGGKGVKSYVAQYKEDRATWDEHRLKSWPANQELFTIEGLEPMRTYYVRFAAENEVGLGDWGMEKVETTPKRSAPEIPVISNAVNGVAITAYPDKFELFWKNPADNGERIEEFLISYQPVRNRTVTKGTQVEQKWETAGQKVELKKAFGEPRYTFRNLAPGTYYKVELRARNKIGPSGPAEIIIKTAAVPGGKQTPNYILLKCFYISATYTILVLISLFIVFVTRFCKLVLVSVFFCASLLSKMELKIADGKQSSSATGSASSLTSFCNLSLVLPLIISLSFLMTSSAATTASRTINPTSSPLESLLFLFAYLIAASQISTKISSSTVDSSNSHIISSSSKSSSDSSNNRKPSVNPTILSETCSPAALVQKSHNQQQTTSPVA